MSGEKARTGLMPIYGHEGACGRGGPLAQPFSSQAKARTTQSLPPKS
jgi:hypothetical protein